MLTVWLAWQGGVSGEIRSIFKALVRLRELWKSSWGLTSKPWQFCNTRQIILRINRGLWHFCNTLVLFLPKAKYCDKFATVYCGIFATPGPKKAGACLMYIYTPQTYFQKITDHHHMNIVIFKNLKIPPLCFFLHCLYKIITKKLGVYNQELSAYSP